MAYIERQDYEYLRRRVRELIIRKGMYVYYYHLLKVDVVSSPAFNDLYKESQYAKYMRFKIKVLPDLAGARDSSMNYSEFGLQLTRKLNFKMFVYTPRDSFTELNMNLLIDGDDIVSTLPIVPQLGDFLRFPIIEELPYQPNGLQDLHQTQFYQVTNMTRKSFINNYLYYMHTVQRTDKHREEQLGDVIVYETNAITFRLDSLYGDRRIEPSEEERNLPELPDIYGQSIY